MFCKHVMTFLCIGTYLGYSKSPKFREWISYLSAGRLKRIEAGSKSAEGLAKSFMVLFNNDLEQGPQDICATANQLKGWQLCDPVKIHAIWCMQWMCVIRFTIILTAVHICWKYLISRFGLNEETARWDAICKKLNGHIQYTATL